MSENRNKCANRGGYYQGFTLIELLAVIVILAIIALIATPIVIDIIDDTKKSAVQRSSELYIKAVELSIAKASLDNIDITTCNIKDNNLNCGGKDYKIEVDGEYPKEVEIKATKDGQVYTAIKQDGYCVIKGEGDNGYSYKKLVDEVNDKEKEADDLSCSLTPVYATSKSCFEFDESTGTIIKYNKDNDKCTDEVVIPSKINGVDVKVIGNSLFKNKRLTSVVIPDSVTTIESSAFYNNQLTSVVIPNSVTTIESSAFCNNRLTKVELPDSVTKIDSWAFSSNSIEQLKLPSGYFSLGKGAFARNKLKEADAFIYKRNNDGSVDYTTIVTYGGESKDIVIPGEKNGVKLTTIESSAFYNNQLTSVVIPDSVTTIGANAFYVNQLTKLELPDSVTKIDSWAFASNSIEQLKLPSGYFSLGKGAFAINKLKEADAFIYKRNNDGSVDYTTIVTYGGESKDIVIPGEKNGVKLTTIESSAFYNNQLTSVVIPDSVTTIGVNAFGVNKLTNLIIPGSVTNIGSAAFNGNPLESVIIKNKKGNLTIGSNAFGTFDINNIVWEEITE